MHITQFRWVLLVAALMLNAEVAAQRPASTDSGGNAYTGSVNVVVFAIDTALCAKAPDALVANPAKWLDFLTRASKERKAYEILLAEVPIRNGAASLERDIKDTIYATGFLWSGDSAVPNPERRCMRRFGKTIEIKSATLEADTLSFEYDFGWATEAGIRRIEGITKEYAYPAAKTLRIRSWATLSKGTTLLAGQLRSNIPPPGCETGPTWQYFLFYSLR